VEAVQPNLQDWLNEASQQGSGDDISVGMIWRPMAVATRSQPDPA
jgi:hypothetical protein